MGHEGVLGCYPLGRLAVLNVAVLVSVVYVRVVIAKSHAGWPRLQAAAPLFALNAALPFLFNPTPEFVCRACSFLLLTWVANFKVLGLVIGRGPLSLPLKPLQLLLIYAWPLTPQQQGQSCMQTESDTAYQWLSLSRRRRWMPLAVGKTRRSAFVPAADDLPRQGKTNARLSHSAGSKSTLLLQSGLKSVLLVGVAMHLHRDTSTPIFLREFMQAFSFYWWLGSLMDGPGAVVGYAAGLSIAPHFDAPYLSASISEFWSKRWNLTVSNALRFTTYDPISEGRLVWSRAPFRFSKARSLLGVLAAFVVSGVMHELFLWYLDSSAPDGRWCMFFVIQGPLVIAESYFVKQSRRLGFSMPRPVAITLTLLALLLMGHILFFPPIVESGLLQLFYGSVIASLPALGNA